MNIGFDGSRAFGQDRTGTENYSFQLLKHLISIDIENRYFIYTNSSQLSAFRLQLLGDTGKEWPENFQFKVINMPRLWTQVGLAFRTFVDPLDILFVPSHTLPILRRPGLKTIITVHDLGAEYLPASHQLKQILYLNLMTHYQLATATRIIAVSESTKKDIQFKTKVPLSRIDVIYEGVDESLFRKLSIDIQNSTLNKYILTRKKYFLFIGTIQPRKNIERIIKAFAAFLKTSDKNDYLLVLAGGKGWKSEGIYKLPKELGIERAVRFIGRVSDEELAILYNGAAALVYPSLFEGFGLPIVEAFACGCPVITSNISSMPEVAGDAAILVDPYRVEEITEAMSDLAMNESIRSSLIQKGSLMLKKFSWKKCAEETLKVIEKVGKSRK